MGGLSLFASGPVLAMYESWKVLESAFEMLSVGIGA